jgi:hypothetical protein
MEASALARVSIAEDGTVDQKVAEYVLKLPRSELKEYLAALRREIRRRRVDVSLTGPGEEPLRGELGSAFSGRELVVSRDDALGGGVKVRSGDDVIDASAQGYVRHIIEKLRET